MPARGLGARRRAALFGACAIASCGAVGALASLAHAGPFPGVPDPGGQEDSPVPVPPPGKFFGYHENSFDLADHGWSSEQVASIVAGGGANAHRFNLDWWNVEPSHDRWSEAGWAKYDRFYDALVAKGIRPLITLGGTPPWARPVPGQNCGIRRGCEWPPAPWANEEWAEFAAEVARRFPQAVAIEIWNEPNLEGFWKPAPNPVRWAQLVSIAYPAIKSVSPGIRVLAGGLSPAQTPQYNLAGQFTHYPMREFLEAAYRASPSIKGSMDAISFHMVFNTLDYGAESLWAKLFADIRSTAQSFGDRGRTLWVSEDALTTSGPQAVSEADQADGLLRQYRRLMTMPDVGGVLIHTLGDRVELAPTSAGFGQGVVESWSPWNPKLAFCTFAEMSPAPYSGCPEAEQPPPPPPSGGNGGGGNLIDDLLGGLFGRR
jgi:hypothetical protein